MKKWIMKKWKCNFCGRIYEWPKPPEECGCGCDIFKLVE